ncbi:MAG: hypothetical protein ACJ72O_17275 [Marmoricola sp.]
MISRARRPALLLSALVVAGLVLSGCGGSSATPQAKETETPKNTQTDVPVPSGVTLTAYGTELKFGESATVAYAPNDQRKSVLQLTVLSASKGSIADLSSYSLEDRTKASTPYYVRVSVKNVGTGDVGRTPIPLFMVDSRDTLISASSFTNTFAKCPSVPLPTTFGPNAAMSTCLVYLAPEHGTMTGVSFRAVQENAPILWKGTVKVPTVPKKPTKKKAS